MHVGLLVSAVLALVGFALRRAPDFFDLRVYRLGSLTLFHGGSLYRIHGPAGLGYTYPPFAAFVMLPMAVPSLGVADALSVLINAGALLWLVLMCLRVAFGDRFAGRNLWTLAVPIAVIVSVLDPVQQTISFGQVNLVLWALVAREMLRLDGGRWRGVGIGVATAVKLTPGLFIVFLLLTRRRADARRALVTFAACTLGMFALYPAVSADFWFRALEDPSRIGGEEYVGNQSLWGALSRLAEPGPASQLIWFVSVLLIAGVWARVVRQGAGCSDLEGLWVTGLCAALVSPISWTHHLIWVVPFLIDLGARALNRRTPGPALWAGVILLAFALRLPWQFAHHVGQHWSEGLVGQALESSYVILMLATLALTVWTRSPSPTRQARSHAAAKMG